VETNLRCASCGTLICPQCLVQTPVGAKCRVCGLQKGGTLFTMRPHRAAAAGAAAIALGAVAGFGVGSIGLFALFVAVAFGTFAGEMIVRASGRKRGVRLEVIAGVGMALGAIAGPLIVALLFTIGLGSPVPAAVAFGKAIRLAIPGPIALVSLAIAIAGAVGRIRYI
jgi:hypothetical protein